MHPMLQRQQIEYTIFVVEQTGNDRFNKGILMNAAFQLFFQKKISRRIFDCVLYHDVDLIPEGIIFKINF